VRTNRYAGPCRTCGAHVAAKTGIITLQGVLCSKCVANGRKRPQQTRMPVVEYRRPLNRIASAHVQVTEQSEAPSRLTVPLEDVALGRHPKKER
jgi:hypothetical protein